MRSVILTPTYRRFLHIHRDHSFSSVSGWAFSSPIHNPRCTAYMDHSSTAERCQTIPSAWRYSFWFNHSWMPSRINWFRSGVVRSTSHSTWVHSNIPSLMIVVWMLLYYQGITNVSGQVGLEEGWESHGTFAEGLPKRWNIASDGHGR